MCFFVLLANPAWESVFNFESCYYNIMSFAGDWTESSLHSYKVFTVQWLFVIRDLKYIAVFYFCRNSICL